MSRRLLAPTLLPGDIVVIDNLGSHKGKAIRRAIRAVGAKLFLVPQYSPDLNPIEQVFAKLNTCCAKPRRAPSKPSPPSASCSKPTRQTNASTTSKTPVMDKPDIIPL
jgi:hypothetical protein